MAVEIENKDFLERYREQLREEKCSRSFGEDDSGVYWQCPLGDYSKPIFFSDNGVPTLTGIDKIIRRENEHSQELIGVEKSIGHMVRELLQKSKKRPILVMDFGGGVGLSWSRLAVKFEEEVRANEVYFVVTNIEKNFLVGAAIENCYNKDSQKDGREVVKYAHEQGLVMHIEAELSGADKDDINSLRQYRVEIDHKSVPFIGNVDIIHTRMSLVHSVIPEIHYPRLFELFSKNGVFLDTSFSAKTPATPSTSVDDGDLIDSKIKQAKYNAYQYVIKNYDMQPVEFVESGEKAGEKMFATVLRKKGSDYPQIWA